MHIVAETLAVIDRKNPETGELELLMGVQQRGQWQSFYNFPGGKAEAGEPVQDAVAREVTEETGLPLPVECYTHIGNLLIFDNRPQKKRFGSVAIFGATLYEDIPIVSKSDEFLCEWINPTQRNILLNMPRDVGYWLPLAFRAPQMQFSCHRTIDEGGGDWYETFVRIPGQSIHAVAEFKLNL